MRLTFVEPDRLARGAARLRCGICKAETVLHNLDMRQGGGRVRSRTGGVVKEFQGVKVVKDLMVTLTATGDVRRCCAASRWLQE